MAGDIVMPRLSDSMEEGTILRWLKQVGEEVQAGEDLVEIETDKANMTYEADASGVLTEILAAEGETLPIGQVIARVGENGEVGQAPSQPAQEETADEEPVEEKAPAEEPAAEEEPAEEEPSEPEPEPVAESVPQPPADATHEDGRVKASPLARRMAQERGVDLESLSGSGPGGRIVKADVEAAGAAPAAAQKEAVSEEEGAPSKAPAVPSAEGTRERPETAKGEATVQELTKLQQTVARRMAESKATAPHFYLSAEIDMSQAVELRGKLKELTPGDTVLPSFNDMIVKACAHALRDHPKANGAYRDGKVELYSRVNVGVAVAARDALVVPTVFDADQRSLGDIARLTRSLVEKVRDGSITPPELSGGTFTVSNLGMYGIENFSAVINPPQAAILAVGQLKKKPVVDDAGEIVARDMMSVTLACDHRILYGSDGAEFLGRIRQLLEEPFSLAL